MIKHYTNNFFIILCLFSCFFSETNIKDINESSQLKFKLNQNIYLSSSLFIDNKEYILPIDISSDRTWINTNSISNTNNKELIIEKCQEYNLNFNTKKNIPISFFDKNIILEDISYEEVSNNLDQLTCDTKNGVIGLSPKSDKKVLNLLNQMNKSYLIKKYFSIYDNELFIGNFDEELKQKKHITEDALDFSNKWIINLQGIYFGNIDSNNKNGNEFVINLLNNDYKKANIDIEFNTLQRLIIVEYYYLDFINTNIFKNKCELNRIDSEKLEGIYCDKSTIEKLPNLGFMINNKLLVVDINKLFIKDKNYPDKYLFVIAFSDIIWENGPCLVGSYFFNELGIKVIFDAENSKIHLLSDNIIDNIKLENDYEIDDKQIILNNNSFSIYDFFLCFILISNFFGIIILLAIFYKEKILSQMPNNIKKIKRMNKQ